MKTPNSAFLEILTTAFACMLSEETVNKSGDQFGKTIDTTIGTGPYILKEWKYGELCVCEANPNCFKGTPDIKNVRAKAIPDQNSAIIALEAGEIDT